MRLPALLGFRPSASCMMPAFTSCSLNLPMSSNILVVWASGVTIPFSLLGVALTNTRTFMDLTPSMWGAQRIVDWEGPKSTALRHRRHRNVFVRDSHAISTSRQPLIRANPRDRANRAAPERVVGQLGAVVRLRPTLTADPHTFLSGIRYCCPVAPGSVAPSS